MKKVSRGQVVIIVILILMTACGGFLFIRVIRNQKELMKQGQPVSNDDTNLIILPVKVEENNSSSSLDEKDELKRTIEEKIREGFTKVALSLLNKYSEKYCPEIEKQVIALQGRFSRFMSQLPFGVIDNEQENITLNKINKDILILLA